MIKTKHYSKGHGKSEQPGLNTQCDSGVLREAQVLEDRGLQSSESLSGDEI